MNIIVIVNTMTVLFGILILGYIINKLGILDEASNKKISELVINVTSPMMIINSVCSDSIGGNKDDLIFIFLLGIALYCVLPIFARIAVKPFRLTNKDSGIYQLLLIFANTGFIGYPILQSVFGDSAIFYSSILNMPFNLLIFTYGVYLITRDRDENISFNPKVLLNSGVVASVIALAIYLTGIKLPSDIVKILGLVGDSTIPLSMMVIGSSLALVPLKDIFMVPKIYPLALIKLIIMPVITYFILHLFIENQFIIGMITINAALPSGSMNVMLSNQYDGNTRVASVGVFITTLASLVTVPLLVYLLGVSP
ncbi:MAG: AEC family transporter [Clostridiaceae bacterium]